MLPPPVAFRGAAAGREHPWLGAAAFVGCRLPYHAVRDVVQCKAPAAGVSPLPRDSGAALCVSIQAFNTLFRNFCLGSNEA